MIKLPLLVAFTGLLVLSGCGYERRAGHEENKMRSSVVGTASYSDAFLDRPVSAVVRYALRMSDQYKSLGDEAALNRDRFAGALIGVAGGAALANVSSVGAAEIAGVTVVGVGLNEGAKYINPNSAAESFFDASSEAACVGAISAEVLAANISNRDGAASAVILRSMRKVELRLRASLQRTIPDFSDLIEIFSARPEGEGADGARSAAQQLAEALQACFPEPKEDGPEQ